MAEALPVKVTSADVLVMLAVAKFVGALQAGAAVVAVTEKSSMARPSSDPAASKSEKRMKKVAPAAMFIGADAAAGRPERP